MEGGWLLSDSVRDTGCVVTPLGRSLHVSCDGGIPVHYHCAVMWLQCVPATPSWNVILISLLPPLPHLANSGQVSVEFCAFSALLLEKQIPEAGTPP